MSPERYRQVKSILQAALELDPAAQPAFLENTCRDDPALKAEVQSLLDHDGQAEGFLEKPPVAAGEARVRLKPGSHLGPYEIDRKSVEQGKSVDLRGRLFTTKNKHE